MCPDNLSIDVPWSWITDISNLRIMHILNQRTIHISNPRIMHISNLRITIPRGNCWIYTYIQKEEHESTCILVNSQGKKNRYSASGQPLDIHVRKKSMYLQRILGISMCIQIKKNETDALYTRATAVVIWTRVNSKIRVYIQQGK